MTNHSRADRSRADLIKADLIKADLIKADLIKADLIRTAPSSIVERSSQATLTEALKKYLLDQLAQIRASLGVTAGWHKAIHRARKSIRRLRSALDLVKPALGEQTRGVDRRLQRLGRHLSTLRDAHAVLLLARARRAAKEGDHRAEWKALAHALRRRRDELLGQALADDAVFKQRIATVDSIGDELRSISWVGLTPGHVCAELEATARQGAEAREKFEHKQSLKRLHRWRKRVRRLRMQVVALEQIFHDGFAEGDTEERQRLQHALRRHSADLAQLSEMSDWLGKRLDLQLLHDSAREVESGDLDFRHIRHALKEEMASFDALKY